MNELMVLAGFILVVWALMPRPSVVVVHTSRPEEPSTSGAGCLPIIVVVLLGLLFIGWLA
jgi:hypothetical protein